MSSTDGKYRQESTTATAKFYTQEETGEDLAAAGSHSDLSSTDSSSFQSDTSSEEEEWEQEVSAKGELFYVQPQATENDEHSKTAPGPVGEPNRWQRDSQNSGHRGEFPENADTVRPPRPATREVTVAVNQRQSNFGRRSSPLEGLLGIVPTRLVTTGTSTEEPLVSDVVVVQAIMPGSEAIKNKDIRIGDWICKLNEASVTWANLDQVVNAAAASQPKQIKLTLRTPPVKSGSSGPTTAAAKLPEATSKRSSQLLLPKLLSGGDEKWSRLTSTLTATPHIVLYLTLATSETSDPKADILYQFPRLSNKLVDIRGALLTLSHLMPEIVGSEPISSSVIIGTNVVHIGYSKEGKEVLLLALPGDCITSNQIHRLSSAIVQALKYQYGSLHEAFAGESNRSNVDHLFAYTFVSYLQTGDVPSESPFGRRLYLPQGLPLSVDLQCCIDETLTEFESSDFADMSEDHYDMRRLYSILGTCLFYKGYLIGNHLPTGDLEDAFLYLYLMGLLETSKKNLMMQAVVWREVFPSKPRENALPQTRWFLLVVGRNYSLMGVLLEAGGCASKATGIQGPDPFYVEQAQSTLLQLDVQLISKSIDSWLEAPPTPSLASADSFLGQNKRKDSVTDKSPNRTAKRGANTSKLSLSALSSRQQNPGDTIGTHPGKEHQTQGETDSDSTSLSLTASGTSDDTTPILGRRAKNSPRKESWSDADSQDENELHQQKVSTSQRYLPSLLDLTAMAEGLPSLDRERNAPPPKLTAGMPNVLFHYLQLNSADGVLICPTDDGAGMGHLHSDVISNFKASCLMIQKMLRHSSKETDVGAPDSNGQLGPFVEQGMFFKCKLTSKLDSNRDTETLSYWVVGRMFFHPHEREVYVCYHDSCPQTMVEIAFQLSFGLTI